MRTEREPNRYEPLNETHRRVAEEEEKRRLAEQEQDRSASAQPEAEPNRPEAEPNRPGTEPRPQRPEAAPDHDPDSPEVRLAAMQKELEEKVRLGRINSSEMVYQLRQFDNQLRVEMEEGRTPPPAQQHDLSGNSRDEMGAGAENAEPQSPQRAAEPHDQIDQSRDDLSQPAPEKRIEREAEAAAYEITGRGEVTDARAARLARLQNIDRAIESERRENEGRGPELDHDSGDHSR